MKIKIIFFVLIFSYFSSLSQIVFENTYKANYGDCQLFNLSNSGYKWCLIDSVNPNSIKIYNINHSLWKTISLNVPSGCEEPYFFNVSETLFNEDGLVEVAYSYVKQPAPSILFEGAKVINENGTEVFDYPLTNSINLAIRFVSTGQNNAKMIIVKRNQNSSYYEFDIYSLPGQLMNNVTNTTLFDNIEINAFPNPTKNNISISYDIPDGKYEGDLIIYNSSGLEVLHYKVDKNFNTLFIDTSMLPAGIYLYKVISGNVESKTKKFIIE